MASPARTATPVGQMALYTELVLSIPLPGRAEVCGRGCQADQGIGDSHRRELSAAVPAESLTVILKRLLPVYAGTGGYGKGPGCQNAYSRRKRVRNRVSRPESFTWAGPAGAGAAHPRPSYRRWSGQSSLRKCALWVHQPRWGEEAVGCIRGAGSCVRAPGTFLAGNTPHDRTACLPPKAVPTPRAPRGFAASSRAGYS
jgi:hypothetical protein